MRYWFEPIAMREHLSALKTLACRARERGDEQHARVLSIAIQELEAEILARAGIKTD